MQPQQQPRRRVQILRAYGDDAGNEKRRVELDRVGEDRVTPGKRGAGRRVFI